MTSPVPFNGVELDDLEIALNSVIEKYPNSSIIMIGVSFGSNLLIRYLRNRHSNVKAAICLATPFNINKTVD